MPNDVMENADNVTSAPIPRAVARGHLRFAETGFASRNIMAVNAA
jgi:hypothetical protein